MVAPNTGPFTIQQNYPYLYQYRRWYRQRRPYDQPLPYNYYYGESTGTIGPGSAAEWPTVFAVDAQNKYGPSQYAKAYSRFVDLLGEPAGLGITLVQWKEADSMIRNRGRQLLGFTSAIMKRSPLGVAASLGISLKRVQAIMRTRYGVARSLSDLWLEFWFGWKPLLNDIYGACEVFDHAIPPERVTASARTRIYELSFPYPTSRRIEYNGFVGYRLGANIRISNPNIHLLQQFGLINPASVAWDAIPWSFVVGWFANVDQWLSSFTDFAGLEISNGYISSKVDIRGNASFPSVIPDQRVNGLGVTVSRVVVSDFPRPRLQLKQDLSTKPTRGLTAISLLTQKLSRFK